jgi:hypothetical protein
MNIYFLTSLPRTGTTSLCKMANICGLKSLHVLKNISFADAINQGYNFFADTPFYSPEFLIGLLELGLKKNDKLENLNNSTELSSLIKIHKVRFIYSHRQQECHKISLGKLFKKWKPPLKIYNKVSLLDHLCYNKLDDNYIKNHYEYIKKISSLYEIDMLDYSFNKGWKDFCNFIEKPIPNKELPHINKL